MTVPIALLIVPSLTAALLCVAIFYSVPSTPPTHQNAMNASDGARMVASIMFPQSAIFGLAVEGLNDLSKKFYQSTDGNTLPNSASSPIGIDFLILQLASGAEGDTKNDFYSVLGMTGSTDSELIEKRRKFIDDLRNSGGENLRLSNRIYYDYMMDVKEEFTDMMIECDEHNAVDSRTAAVPFGDGHSASLLINAVIWHYSDVQYPIAPAHFTPETSLFVVNAGSFTSNWLNSFNANWTESRKFHFDAERCTDVPTMHGYDYYKYGTIDDVDAEFIEIPYKKSKSGNETRMLIVLPNEKNGISTTNFQDSITRAFTSKKSFTDSQHPIHLYLPKFKVQSANDLEKPLRDLKLAKIFDESANFSNIADRSPMKVDKIFQIVSVHVNEGPQPKNTDDDDSRKSEMSKPSGPEFVVDRPFLFAIVSELESPLFIGVVNDPTFEHPRAPIAPNHAVNIAPPKYPARKEFIPIPRDELFPTRPVANASLASPERKSVPEYIGGNLNNFSLKLIQLFDQRRTDNYFYSPTAITLLLSQIIFGARGCTKDEVYPVLGFEGSNDTALVEERQLLVDYLRNSIRANFQSATGIFYDQPLELKQRFLNLANEHDDRNIIESRAIPVDFENRAEVRQLFTDWMNYHSHGITHDYSSSNFWNMGYTRFYVVNTVYFESNWLNSFDARWTELRRFDLNDETYKKVPTMHGYGLYNHGSFDDIDAKFVEIPFEKWDNGDETRMLIIVPNKNTSLEYLKSNLHRLILSERSFSNAERPIHVYLPKFKLESRAPVHVMLGETKLRRIFESSANLQGINDRMLIYVSRFDHFALLDVNEGPQKDNHNDGVSEPLDLRSQSGPEIVVDRPFAVAIVTKSRVPLLVGIVFDPTGDNTDREIYVSHPTSVTLPVNEVLRPSTQYPPSEKDPKYSSTTQTPDPQPATDVPSTSSSRIPSGLDAPPGSPPKQYSSKTKDGSRPYNDDRRDSVHEVSASHPKRYASARNFGSRSYGVQPGSVAHQPASVRDHQRYPSQPEHPHSRRTVIVGPFSRRISDGIESDVC